MAKKKNPHITLKQSDVRRIKANVTKDATENAFVIFFTVMHNKWGFGRKRMWRLFKQVQEHAAMVNETPHCVTIEQLKRALRDETGIDFT